MNLQESKVRMPRAKIPILKFHTSATAPRIGGVSPSPAITPMAMVAPVKMLRSSKDVSFEIATSATGKNPGEKVACTKSAVPNKGKAWETATLIVDTRSEQ